VINNKEQFELLVHKYIAGTITEAENAELKTLLDQEAYALELDRIFQESFRESEEAAVNWSDNDRQVFVNKLMDKARSKENASPVRRMHWLKYAAAVILVAGLGTIAFIFTKQEKEQPAVAETEQSSEKQEIAPGGEKAVLKLADGTIIHLDNAAKGQVAEQGGVEVVKLASGQIAYRVKQLKNKEVMWNTMSTPRGGQYQLILPDGTHVWLNAASSITYPTAFTGNKREIKIKGEVFLEVAKNKQKPFFVNINDKSSIRVLGTSFNINSYDNEENITTTLVEGSIQINKNIVLKPGQQAVQLKAADDIVVSEADVEKALAWKNGWFNFNGASLYDVMRQLERWYDIDVKYEGEIPQVTFKGKMDKGVTLTGMLNIFSALNYKFKTKLEGRTLLVTGD
jgi:Fe2+-dicitrate sensor, membrane component